ncbi:cardiolipin synthase [Alienimonas chondri]|uniref:Cardiolipin synthase n=1 Tax=Alienimonas chondri TaxID=2681879 RepID=A0ABX1VED1_9PLAN|nr:cardiolipin synthase [Alienimonas chondri]NNJ25396.1 Major cardiolipin synthase ClsA [Alienimonas chondri]
MESVEALAHWMADHLTWATIPLGLWALSLGLIPVVLLSRSSQPSGKVAWVLSIAGLPLLGGLLYLVFSAGRERKYAAAKRKADDELKDLLSDPDEEDPGDAPAGLRQVWDLSGVLAGHPAAGGNAVRTYADAAAGIDRLVEAIDAAERSVSMEFYTFRSDDTGARVRDALTRAAKRGVEVRLLYDRFGSLGLTKRFLRPLTDAGGQAETFAPRANGLVDRLRLNMRNHRKIVVIDGAFGFTGGVNVGDEYMSRDPGTAPWRDTLVEVYGPAAGRLQRVFAQDWLYIAREALTEPRLYHGFEDFPEPEGDGWLRDVVLRVLDDGPDRRDRAHESIYSAAIHAARESIELSTGYFVPTEPIDRALQCAARRGVKVRIMHGGPGSPWATRWAARWQYADLMDSGAEIYEAVAGVFHPKLLTVDDRFGLIGSTNCDTRSFRLNFEISLITLDAPFARSLAEQFDRDLSAATRIAVEGWSERPLAQRLGEAAASLFNPVL